MRSITRAGIGAGLLVVAALLLAACGGGGPGGTSATPTSNAPTAEARCDLGETQPPPVLAACEDMLLRFDQPPEDVVSVTAREWPNACLGVPEPAEVCAQAPVSGYVVVFAIGIIHYTYHTDENSGVRLASVDLKESQPAGQLVVSGRAVVAFDFTPDGRLFFNQQLGQIRWIDLNAWDPAARVGDGELFAEVETYHESECGLIGLAVDPEFATNHYIYVYGTQPDPTNEKSSKARLIRYTDVDGKGEDPTVLVGDLPLTNPVTCAHIGGNIHFGPDGYLYLSIGNMQFKDTADDLSSPLGKILRLDKADGSAAPGNPFADDPDADPRIFAYGLRNPFDFAFHPQTGVIYSPDNGPGNCDELNIIEAGMDYGHPGSTLDVDTESCLGLGGVDPIYLFALPGTSPEEFQSNVAPAGVTFLSEGVYPGLGTGLLVCEFLTRILRYLEFEGPNLDEVARDLVLIEDCRYNVATDDEGIIYYSFDRGIYRLPPEALAEVAE